MKKLLRLLGQLFIFLFLTILTQIGGVVYFLSLLTSRWGMSRFWKKRFGGKNWVAVLGVFLVLYLGATFLIVPFVAPMFGREPVKHSKSIRPTNYFTVLLNRNYVRPALNDVLKKTAQELEKNKTDIQIRYLDACFPFVDKFPLLPHLSHNDGKKIDISFVYETSNGEISNKKKSVSGYGVFEEPTSTEFNQTKKCKSAGYFQYDFTKYASLGRVHRDLQFSNKGNKTLIKAILKNKEVGKIFIEPHLKSRLRLKDSRIRFHGCRAVRHDDHIHVQL